MPIELTKIYFFLTLSLIVIYFLGKAINYFLAFQNDNNIFFNLFIGSIFSVITISIFSCGIKTIQILFLIPMASALIINKEKFKINSSSRDFFLKKDFLNIGSLTFVSLIIYVFNSFQLISLEPFYFKPPHPDFFHYAKHSIYMFQSGNENYFRESNLFFQDVFSGISPYHYFEIWLNTIFYNCFQISSIKSLMLITFPFLQICCIFGLIEISSYYFKSNFFLLLLSSIILLNITPIYFSFYENFEILNYSSGICQTSILGFSKKYSPIVMFTIAGILLFKMNKKPESFLSIVSIPILSIGTMPGLVSSLILALIFLFLMKKQSKYLKYTGYVIFIVLLIGVFYYLLSLNAINKNVNNDNLLGLLITNGFSTKIIMSFIFKVVFPLFRAILLTLPYLILILIFARKSLKKKDYYILIPIYLLLITASFSVGLAFNIPDNTQLLYNCIPIVNIFLVLFLLAATAKSKSKILVCIFLIISSYNFYQNQTYSKKMNDFYKNVNYSFSNSFIIGCITELEQNKNPRLGYISHRSNISPNAELFINPALQLDFADNNPMSICVNRLREIDLNSEYANYAIDKHPFLRYSLKNKTKNYENNIREFVEYNKISYFLIEKGATRPPLNLDLLKYDSLSNYGFYKIKHK